MELATSTIADVLRSTTFMPEGDAPGGRPPILLSELGDYVPIKWFWEGFVAPNRKTIFVGHPKAGKTTLMAHLVKGLSGVSTSVGPPVSKSRTLIITEECADHWKRRREELEMDGCEIYLWASQRFGTYKEWNECLDWAAKFMRLNDVQVLIIDTLSHVWPVLDENDAAATGRGLDPINKLSEAGFAVVCVHHAPKAKQSAVISARGSTAITAFFDIVINMRTAGRGSHTTRRSLKAWGRDPETPETLILDYQGVENGYVASTGDDIDEDEAIIDLDMELVIKALPTEGDGVGLDAVRKKVKMANVTIKALLTRAVKQERAYCDGTGVRGNPFRYLRAEGQNGEIPD